jgi:flagellar hook-associated protein 3 FlgL
MRVTQEGLYRNLTNYLQEQISGIDNLNEQISSGKKIINLSDSPIDSSQIIQIKKKLNHIEQYNKDITRANAWVATTNSSLENVNDIVQNLKVTTEQASTETYNYQNRLALSNSVDAMTEELMQNINTEINGKYIFSGFKTDTKPFRQKITSSDSDYTIDDFNHSFDLDIKIEMLNNSNYKFSVDGGSTWQTGEDGNGYKINAVNPVLGFTISSTSPTTGDVVDISVTHEYQGDSGEFKIETNREDHVAINITGDEAYTGSDEKNIFKITGNLWAGLVTNNRELIAQQLDKLSSFEKNNLKLLAKTGSRTNRLDIIKNNFLVKDKENSTAHLSDLEDADLTEAMSELALQQTVFQATLKTTAMISNLTLVNFL